MRVIVTRPAAQAQGWVQQLQQLGLDAVSLPLVGIAPPVDPARVQQAWADLPGAALAMFVSPNAVMHFFQARPDGAPWPAAVRAGSTGPGTTAALKDAGVPLSLIVEPPAAGPFDTETLWQQIGAWPWPGRTVLVVRGEDGRDWLSGQLRAAGADVQFVAAYRRVAPPLDTGLVEAALADPAGHVWHFTSSEGIAHLLAQCPGRDWSASRALATHPRIADAARRAGFNPVQCVGVRPQDVVQVLRP
jgi:uroporphyrinogen-III synthase